MSGDVNFDVSCQNSNFPSHFYHNLYTGNVVYDHSYPKNFNLSSEVTERQFRVSNGSGGIETFLFNGRGQFQWKYKDVEIVNSKSSTEDTISCIRFESGLQICWQQSRGSFTEGNTWTFPNPFILRPLVIGSVLLVDGYVYIPNDATPTSVTYNNSSGNYTSLLAIGWWK